MALGMRAAAGLIAAAALVAAGAPSAAGEASLVHWEPAGWGGGGWYWAAVFDPVRDGGIYIGQDTGGLSKTTDHGLTWRMINDGLANCAVYSLAVDRSHPDTVYAGTEGGLHKSTDAGEHWRLLPGTGPKDLRLTSERGRSVRSIAVDPVNGATLYAASPGGKVYKSADGGETWAVAYEKQAEAQDTNAVFVQFGGVNGAWFAGAWLNVAFPAEARPEEGTGIGFSFRGDRTAVEKGKESKVFLQLKNAAGVMYQSRDLAGIFQNESWADIVLKAADFTVDPASAGQFPNAPPSPMWAEITRLDFACNGPMTPAAVGRIRSFFFVLGGAGDAKPLLKTVRDFTTNRVLQTYGNARVTAAPPAKAIGSVAVALRNPSRVVAATSDAGAVLSEDAGKTWRELPTPPSASSVVFADSDPAILYGCFGKAGVWKSVDGGTTWAACTNGMAAEAGALDIAVSPTNALDVYVVGDVACITHDGGSNWTKAAASFVDFEGDPTRHYGGKQPTQRLARSKNIVINPRNPQELYVAQDWRPAWSGDGGQTWYERVRGSDIVCNTDIRFSKGRVYACGMDVGALVSEDNGRHWKQLWPPEFLWAESGHCWRLAIRTDEAGVDHIVSTFNPWNSSPKKNVVILSDDGGKTRQVVTNGLPGYVPLKNTMWEVGHMRALAADPADPKVLYAGIDGDAEPGKCGGGIFKSVDGGHTWAQLAHQPGSRRMFYGLAVDPTDSRRIFWGACAAGGGVWMTENGGESWTNVLSRETWIWNIVATKEGRVYASSGNLWRSDDHGRTWTPLTHFTGRTMQGFEVDPRDPKTLWVSAYSRDRLTGSGIYKTTDDGATWTDITGDCPNRQPQILRFNPETRELWCGWVGLYKLKQ